MIDLGMHVVEHVFRTMKIDKEWSVWDQRGFHLVGRRLRVSHSAAPANCVAGQVVALRLISR